MMSWRLAWRNVQRNRRRSLVTMLIAAVGVLAVLVASGFALHTYTMLEEGSAREFGHLTVAHKDYFSKEEETPLQYGISNYSDLMHSLSKNTHVRRLLPRLSLSGLISNGDRSIPFMGLGADVEAEVATQGEFLLLKEGSASLPADDGGAPRVLIGVDMAKSLNVRPGSGLTLLVTTMSGGINAVDVTVAGTVSTGWREIDKRLVYMQIGTAQNLLQSDRITTLAVNLDQLEATASVRAQWAAEYPDYVFQPWWEQSFYYTSVRQLYDRIFGLLGTIIALLVFFSVANTLAMAVTERTREIGTLRALGAFPKEIVQQFVREGVLIGGVGAALGTVLSVIVVLVLPYAELQMPPPPGRSVGYPLLVSMSALLYLITNIVIILICASAAWFVSRKASRRPVVEALTHV